MFVLYLIAFLDLLLITGGCGFMQPAAPNSISGHVYTSDGKTPIAGARIDAKDNNGRHIVCEVFSSADGSFTLAGLSAGEYTVDAYAEGYMSEYYDGHYMADTKAEDATKLIIIDGKAVKNIDFTLDSMASISGHVYRADNKNPIDKASVLVYGPHFSTGPMSAKTSQDGSYKVISLNSGQSTVVATAQGYIPRFFNSVYVPEQVTKVTTTLGEEIPNIDFYLEWGGSISGRVYKLDGVTPDAKAGIYYIQISGVETPILGGCVPTPPCQGVEAAPDGTYRIGGLLTGDYEVMAVTRDSKPSYVTGVNRISVIQGKETEGVNFVLGPRTSMSGHVYYNDGKTPVIGATVGAYGWCGFEHHVKTDSSGYYFIDSMVPGSYAVSALNLRNDPARVTVSAGKETVHDIILSVNPK